MSKEVLQTKRHTPKYHIRKNDTVQVLSGDDKGKVGKVKRVIMEEGKAVVEGINMITRHTKPNAKNPNGGRITKEAPMNISKLSLLDPESGKPTRVGRKVVNGKSVRYSKKSKEKQTVID